MVNAYQGSKSTDVLDAITSSIDKGFKAVLFLSSVSPHQKPVGALNDYSSRN
jgi:hypothetical protein